METVDISCPETVDIATLAEGLGTESSVSNDSLNEKDSRHSIYLFKVSANSC